MVAWTTEAEHQLLLLALKQAPKFAIDPDQVLAEWTDADKPTIRSVRDRFNMLRRKSGGNGLTVASGGARTPALGIGSAKRKPPRASNIVTPTKNTVSDILGTSKTNGHNTSDAGVAIQDPSVGDEITFPLTPSPTTETKKSRRRSYTRRPPGSSTAFIDMDPAHFPAPPVSSPVAMGKAVVKSEIQESEAAKMSEGVDGVIAATPGSIGEGSAEKAEIHTPYKSKPKLNGKVKGEVNGNDKINGKTNARNITVTNSITNSTTVAKSIANPNSIARGSGSGSGNSNKKRKAFYLSSSSRSNSDGEVARSSDANSVSVSESESRSESDTSGDEIFTPSKSVSRMNGNSNVRTSSYANGYTQGNANAKVNGKVNLNGKADAKANANDKGNANSNTSKIDNDFSAALSASPAPAATPRKSLPRRSKSITPARAYVDNGADSDEKIGVLGNMSGVNVGVGVSGSAGLGVGGVKGDSDGKSVGTVSGVGGDGSDDEMDLDFNIDADFDFDVAVDDEVDSDIDVNENEWFGAMGFDAKAKGVGAAKGNGNPSWKGRIGSVKGKSGNGKKGWRERVSKFEV